jgi:hypothetical protein
VRGDSLRDFQAKVLAIAGLGVLAGVGALVDYWPTGGSLPPMLAGSAARPEVPVPTPASVAAARPIEAAVPAGTALVTRRAPAATPPVVLEPVDIVASAGAMPIGQPVTLGTVEFAVPQAPVAPAVPATDAPAAPIDLPAPPIAALTTTRAPHTLAPTLGAPESEPGFVMGTLRKTGAGLAKTGAVTGASILDAFRGVAGAFKKVSPFRDRGFIESN